MWYIAWVNFRTQVLWANMLGIYLQSNFFGESTQKKEENERESMSKNLTWLTGLCGFLYWHWLTQKRGFVVNEMLLHQKSHNCSPLLIHCSTFQPHTMDCQRRNERQLQSFVHQTWHQMLALYLEESRNSHYLPKIFPFPKFARHSCPFHPTHCILDLSSSFIPNVFHHRHQWKHGHNG